MTNPDIQSHQIPLEELFVREFHSKISEAPLDRLSPISGENNVRTLLFGGLRWFTKYTSYELDKSWIIKRSNTMLPPQLEEEFFRLKPDLFYDVIHRSTKSVSIISPGKIIVDYEYEGISSHATPIRFSLAAYPNYGFPVSLEDAFYPSLELIREAAGILGAEDFEGEVTIPKYLDEVRKRQRGVMLGILYRGFPANLFQEGQMFLLNHRLCTEDEWCVYSEFLKQQFATKRAVAITGADEQRITLTQNFIAQMAYDLKEPPLQISIEGKPTVLYYPFRMTYRSPNANEYSLFTYATLNQEGKPKTMSPSSFINLFNLIPEYLTFTS